MLRMNEMCDKNERDVNEMMSCVITLEVIETVGVVTR